MVSKKAMKKWKKAWKKADGHDQVDDLQMIDRFQNLRTNVVHDIAKQGRASRGR